MATVTSPADTPVESDTEPPANDRVNDRGRDDSRVSWVELGCGLDEIAVEIDRGDLEVKGDTE